MVRIALHPINGIARTTEAQLMRLPMSHEMTILWEHLQRLAKWRDQ